jgi:hypothetical protein
MIEFRDRVIAQGRKKHATRTGIVVVLAKHLKAALEAAVHANPSTPAPDIRKALAGDVDWYAIAEHVMDATQSDGLLAQARTTISA